MFEKYFTVTKDLGNGWRKLAPKNPWTHEFQDKKRPQLGLRNIIAFLAIWNRQEIASDLKSQRAREIATKIASKSVENNLQGQELQLQLQWFEIASGLDLKSLAIWASKFGLFVRCFWRCECFSAPELQQVPWAPETH